MDELRAVELDGEILMPIKGGVAWIDGERVTLPDQVMWLRKLVADDPRGT